MQVIVLLFCFGGFVLVGSGGFCVLVSDEEIRLLIRFLCILCVLLGCFIDRAVSAVAILVGLFVVTNQLMSYIDFFGVWTPSLNTGHFSLRI